ncbi:leucine-rich repeat domain-containing protein [Kordia sp.]|uniref:leucine-rich repeat domain-containing protein n=1 Tax=Kordia sp. TaxID=1965332 RepID=UPI003B5C30CA
MITFDDDDLDDFFNEDEQERDDDDNLVTYIHESILPNFEEESTSDDTILEVIFDGTDDEDKPFDFQEKTLEYIRENLASILNTIYEFAYKEREPLEELYGSSDNDMYGGFPLLSSPKEVREYISFDTILIDDEDIDGFTTFGFTGSCDWDHEHGLGIKMYKNKILNFGGWDDGRYAFHGDIENPKLSMIEKYMIGTPITHILDTLSYESVSKTEEKGLLDLFDFLVGHRAIYGLRSTNLNLSDTDKIKLLQNIKSLSLRNKGIKKIPKNFSLLKNIERLDFSFNKISKIPTAMNKLKKLVSLDISFNKFKEIPEVVFELDTLEYLDFSKNKIKKIPKGIGNLKTLVYLTVGDNKIKKFPKSLFQIKTLEQLYATDNSFSETAQKSIEKKFEHISVCYL